jgi:hypothetical protein
MLLELLLADDGQQSIGNLLYVWFGRGRRAEHGSAAVAELPRRRVYRSR